jgi:hypothetical protein
MYTTTSTYTSPIYFNRYFQIEIEADTGIMYSIYSKGDVYESEILTYLWVVEGGVDYDTKIDDDALKFLESVLGTATKF